MASMNVSIQGCEGRTDVRHGVRAVLEPLVQVEHDRALCPIRLIVVM